MRLSGASILCAGCSLIDCAARCPEEEPGESTGFQLDFGAEVRYFRKVRAKMLANVVNGIFENLQACGRDLKM